MLIHQDYLNIKNKLCMCSAKLPQVWDSASCLKTAFSVSCPHPKLTANLRPPILQSYSFYGFRTQVKTVDQYDVDGRRIKWGNKRVPGCLQ
jgi:hypothetical protein